MAEYTEQLCISGTITEIIYTNEENGYTVCEIDSESEGQFTATGYLPYISEGESIELFGSWTNHPDYGEQFHVVSFKSILPSDVNAILHYLSSGIIPGVRAATAKKIVTAFGEDTFNVMLNYPERLSEISGISKNKAEKIGEEFYRLQSLSGIMMFLQQYNISPSAAVSIHRLFGSDAVEKIKINPYILADNIDGITFRTSDMIASSLGLAKNSCERISSYIRYYLTGAAYQSGHTYLPHDLIVENSAQALEVTNDEVQSAISSLSMQKNIISDTIDGVNVCYLSTLLSAEIYVARRICSLSLCEPKSIIAPDKADALIEEIASAEGIILANEQKNAVLSAVMNCCIIITGGPGTGKTTTINTIIKLMQRLGLTIALTAPTGRAAKRMSEVTGLEAKTIHRLLGVMRDASEENVTFSRNEDNPLTEDVIIVDEISMLDINLMSSLLKAVKPGASLVMVGDYDQLPSVGPGNVLRDLINSQIVPVIRLEHIFRQAQESMIVVNAHKVNKGEIPVIKTNNTDFFFIAKSSSDMVLKTIADLYARRLPKTYGVNPVTSIQILSPARKGTLGVNSLNAILRDEINPPSYLKNEHSYAKTTFRVGDKVMQTKNNYDIIWTRDSGEEGMGIFNGDIGIIERISAIDKVFDIVFDDDKHVEYSFNNLGELDLAYAVTVHKSQGNEFPFVIIPVSNFPPMLMFRNLLYTAITRAKQMVILVGDERCILRMINNNEQTKRFSGLPQKLEMIKQTLDECETV